MPPPVHAQPTTKTHYLTPSNTSHSPKFNRLLVSDHAFAKMDVLKAVQTYVMKMITEVPGMKVLLLDAHTVRFGFRLRFKNIRLSIIWKLWLIY